jgi:RNA polymerase sigma factor (sigma-70 family)
MAPAATGALTEELAGLFGAGTCAGFSDGELLERFRSCRDDAGERAFETLVTRHGPMVLGICRNILGDPSDVHDAFQAVFLVLARRAGAIRKSESVGSWLYGVTVRVAARARAAAIRRRVRERRVLTAASSLALARDGPDASGETSVEHREGVVVVHEEVVRLPERYRAPIVLCYLEGLTHDQAAARLRCPVGTVRSRLARGRDRLRARLTRRGVAEPATTGPLTDRILADRRTASSSSASREATTEAPLFVPVPASWARDAVRLAADPPAAAGSWAPVSITLADGVLRTMILKKLTVAACVVASIAIAGGAGTLLIRRARAQDSSAPVSASGQTAKRAPVITTPKPPETPPLLQELIDVARERLRAQQAFYEKGRITIDRYIQASIHLEKVELLAAPTLDARKAIRQRHVNRLKEIERRERAEFQVGRSTEADLAEARQARLEAEFEMGASEKEDAEKTAILRRVAELERRIEQFEKERSGRGGP